MKSLGDYKKLKQGIVNLHKVYVADAVSADGSKKKAGQQIGDADEHRKESEGRKQKEIMLANYRDFLLKDQQSHK